MDIEELGKNKFAFHLRKTLFFSILVVLCLGVKIFLYPSSVEVKEGTAHLSGTFASQAEKDDMIAKLKAIPGVKDVHDMSTVAAPVQTTSSVDPAVQQKVQDVVKDFPSVKVENVNGELVLTGNVSPAQARKIKESVDALKVTNVKYNYTVK